MIVSVADAVPGFLPLVEPVAELADVKEDAFAPFFLGDRAFSAQLPKRLETLLCFVGDFESPSAFSAAGVGRTLGGLPPGVGRDMDWILVDAGESTLDTLSALASVRAFFFGTSETSSPPPLPALLPEISLLRVLASLRLRHQSWGERANLVLLGGLPGPGRDEFVAWDLADVEDSARTRGLSFSGTGGRVDCDTACEGVGLPCWGC